MCSAANAEVYVHPDFDETRNRVANVAVVKVSARKIVSFT